MSFPRWSARSLELRIARLPGEALGLHDELLERRGRRSGGRLHVIVGRARRRRRRRCDLSTSSSLLGSVLARRGCARPERRRHGLEATHASGPAFPRSSAAAADRRPCWLRRRRRSRRAPLRKVLPKHRSACKSARSSPLRENVALSRHSSMSRRRRWTKCRASPSRVGSRSSPVASPSARIRSSRPSSR